MIKRNARFFKIFVVIQKTIMKKSIYFLSLVFIIFGFTLNAQVRVHNTKCEYLSNPLGIDEQHPRFTWQIESQGRGCSQKVYQLVVGTEQGEVAAGKGDVWQSGSVGSAVVPAVYGGTELQPFTRYYWSVRIQDETGQWSDWSPVAFFEMGLMDQRNWKGQWISDTHDYNVKPAPYFRKAFKAGKAIRSARAYITAGGIFELSVNGNPIGNHRLDPTYTR